MGDDDKTFRLRYVGTRFNGMRLPVEVLSDLPAFRDLLVAFAKDEWRKINSERKRVPRGFDKSISFDLIGVEDGSAVPMIDWNRSMAQEFLPGFSDQLSEIVTSSYNDILKLVDDAGSSRFPSSLSPDHIRALNRLGSGLKDGERIEFQGSAGEDGNVVYLDTFRRKNLITHVKETYQTRFEGFGILTANDSTNEQIKVQTTEYGEILIPMDGDEILKTYDGNLHQDIQFDIQIELDHSERYRSVVSVFDCCLIDAQIGEDLLKCRNKLDEISALGNGWLDGGGNKVDAVVLETARHFVSRRPSLCGAYKIYPSEDGGILFEFKNNGWDISVEFNGDGSIEMYGVEISGINEKEPEQFSGLDNGFMARFDDFVGR